MKAKVKATGEIVEVMYSTEMGVGTSNGVYLVQDLEEIESDYWTRLEHTYAGMAMQGFLSCSQWEVTPRNGMSLQEATASAAYDFAHALVEKLKEE